MSRYEYFIHLDCGGYSAEDKEAVMDLIRGGRKTVAQMAAEMGKDARHVSNVVRYIEGLGVIQKAGRCHGRLLYEVKA